MLLDIMDELLVNSPTFLLQAANFDQRIGPAIHLREDSSSAASRHHMSGFLSQNSIETRQSQVQVTPHESDRAAKDVGVEILWLDALGDRKSVV